MVTVDRFISIDPIGYSVKVTKECDWCGRLCDGMTREDKLRSYKGEQLCYECLWDAMENDEVFTEVE